MSSSTPIALAVRGRRRWRRTPTAESTPTAAGIAPASAAEAAGLRPERHQRVGDEQVVEAAVGEDLGLADRADRQPDGAGGELASRRPRCSCGSWRAAAASTPRSAIARAIRVDRRVHPVEIDDDGRRVDGGARRQSDSVGASIGAARRRHRSDLGLGG